MGKMKALLIDIEEDGQQVEDLSMYEEAHYHHVMNDFVSLIQEHGWSKVEDSLIEKLMVLKREEVK
jgi:predicted metal-dependent phosphotriesterase family hydrolase